MLPSFSLLLGVLCTRNLELELDHTLPGEKQSDPVPIPQLKYQIQWTITVEATLLLKKVSLSVFSINMSVCTQMPVFNFYHRTSFILFYVYVQTFYLSFMNFIFYHITLFFWVFYGLFFSDLLLSCYTTPFSINTLLLK